MNKQLIWLKELFDKKPKVFNEFFYDDIDRYLGIEFEDIEKNMEDLFRICGDYAKEFIACDSKLEVKKWLDEIVSYVTHNLEIEYLIENYIESKRKRDVDTI